MSSELFAFWTFVRIHLFFFFQNNRLGIGREARGEK